VVFGPGSWFTSVLPHLLVPELAAALHATAARRMVVLNLAPRVCIAVAAVCFLSFIGAGTPPIIPSWGNIMAEARSLFQIANYLIFFPGLFLSLAVLSVNLLGDGLRDALDPRLARNM